MNHSSAQPLVVFSHGNSFPASTYSVLFQSLRSRGFQVSAIEKFGHDPRYPVTSNWPGLVQQLADFGSAQIQQSGQPGDQPVFLVGHSLGGFLSLMCAASHPVLGGQRIKGVVMLDSPLLGGWRAQALSVAKRAQLVGSVSPGTVSRKRRQQWLGREEVLAHFRSKKPFARWDEQVLRDYIEHGTHELDLSNTTPGEDGAPQGQRLLSFDRDVETAIYNTLPHNLERLLRAHALQCPASFIGGRQSGEEKKVGMALTEKITQGRIMMLDGSHLFSMEKPPATAAAIEAAIRNMAGVKLAAKPPQ